MAVNATCRGGGTWLIPSGEPSPGNSDSGHVSESGWDSSAAQGNHEAHRGLGPGRRHHWLNPRACAHAVQLSLRSRASSPQSCGERVGTNPSRRGTQGDSSDLLLPPREGPSLPPQSSICAMAGLNERYPDQDSPSSVTALSLSGALSSWTYFKCLTAHSTFLANVIF